MYKDAVFINNEFQMSIRGISHRGPGWKIYFQLDFLNAGEIKVAS